MNRLFAALLVAHGGLHLLGAAQAFGLVATASLAVRIDARHGLLWMSASALLCATAVALLVAPRWWWLLGAGAVVVSQCAIATSWSEARYGTLINAVALIGVTFGLLSYGPWSFRAAYHRERVKILRQAVPVSRLSESDLAHLPAVVQRYIRLSGAVGQPRIQNFRARFHGQIRSGPDARWMSFTGQQTSSYGPPSRLFLMDASMFGLPVQAFHRFMGPSASMRVKLAAVVTMVDAKGPEMDEAETVTLFNDMCVFAPGVLIASSIQWRDINQQTVAASFSNAGLTVRAVLSFNERGELADFLADGRGAASVDGKTFIRMPWSTPLANYRAFGPHWLMSSGEGVWHGPTGQYSYLRLKLDAIDYNVATPVRQD